MLSTSTSTTSPPASTPTNTMMFSAGTQQCITQFMLNAPSDPTGYPCSTCLPLLTAVPANATAVYPVARDATQFCGLRSIWEDAGQQGQAGLEAGGWVKDVKFCAWNGVRCNGAGRVSSLYVPSSYFFPEVFNRNPSALRQLSFPAIPASLPAQFTNLTALESLEIVGNGNSPGMTLRDLSPNDVFTRQLVAGSFPTDFGTLTKLTSLHLENTALGTLPDTLQDLTSLTLVRNVQLGSLLPPSVGGSALQSL
jgi:hypothetical protein